MKYKNTPAGKAGKKEEKPKVPNWMFTATIWVGVILVCWLAFIVVMTVSATQIAHAQEVTASVSCNETNRLYSSSCMDWDEQGNSSGEIMGTPYYTLLKMVVGRRLTT